MKIRPILPSDNEAVRDIIQSVILEYGAPKIGTAYSDAATQSMYSHYQQPRSAYFVIVDQGEVIGGAGIGPLQHPEANFCELQKMYFKTAARGKGMGRQLMDLCLATARNFKYQQVYIETMDNMYEAQKLYKKVGFELLAAPLGDTGHFSCPVQMIKKL